ncbi:MAG: 1,4-alpha-glucan branching enzyme, partial [Methylobacterium sp.]|nr:1,4-alpha-glucan branching enzyme [Methylobacterium sp.]
MATRPKHDPQLTQILEARHHDPFSWLGLHAEGDQSVMRCFLPHAGRAWLQTASGWEEMKRDHEHGLFVWKGKAAPARPCRLRVEQDGRSVELYDPYTFPSLISEHDLFLFGEGRLHRAYDMLGAHQIRSGGVTGTRFAVWAPNAERVSVIGDFNRWDGRVHPMRSLGSSGIWEVFLPELPPGSLYK